MRSIALLLFWVSLATLVYTYAGYPLLLAVISLFRRARKPAPDFAPQLSIVIAAYNEEKSIRTKLEQTLALDYPADRLEVLVVSDGSTDNTEAIVESFHDPRVRLVRISDRKGKTNAQNVAASQAHGDVLIFSDATTIYHTQALRFLACNFRDPSIGAASGRYQYFDTVGHSPTGLGSVAFWNYENTIKTLQSRIYTITGCCGCIYAVRRQVYTPLACDVISDLVQPLHVILKGYRVVFEDRALAYEETTKSNADEFAMRVRIVTRALRGLLSVKSLLFSGESAWASFQLWSHKIIRWFVPFLLLTLLASNAVLAFEGRYVYIAAAQAAFYSLALVSLWVPVHRKWKIAGIPLYFCILNAAAFLSVFQVIRGHKYTVWQTVRP